MTDTKSQLPAIRAALDAALAEIAKKHGLVAFKSGACTYDAAGSFHFKIEGTVAGGLSKEASLYNQIRHFENLPPLGTKFKHRDGEDEIIGANTTGSKIITRRGAKTFLWKPEFLKMAVQRAEAAAKA